MEDLEVLRELVTDKTLVLVEQDIHGKNILVLREPESQPGYSVTIRSVPDGAVAIKMDDLVEPGFRGTKGENRRADFVIVAGTNARMWMVYVELQHGKKSGKEVAQQLRGARCVMAYCRMVGREFWEERGFLDERNYQERFVSIAHIGIDKKPTRWKPGRLHDTPEGAVRLSSPRGSGLRFEELVGRGD